MVSVVIISMLFAIFIALFVVSGIILNHNTLYCMFYERKEYNCYCSLILLPDENFSIENVLTFKDNRRFICFKCQTYPEWSVYIDPQLQQAFVSENKTNNSVACGFYERGSRILYDKLIKLYKK